MVIENLIKDKQTQLNNINKKIKKLIQIKIKKIY